MPKDADAVLLRASTVVQSEAVCSRTPVRLATWGYGMVGYLTSRAGAYRCVGMVVRAMVVRAMVCISLCEREGERECRQEPGANGRLLQASTKGFNSPLDGHVWHHGNKLYVTGSNFIDHGACANPCPSSIRTWLNGEVPNEPD